MLFNHRAELERCVVFVRVSNNRTNFFLVHPHARSRGSLQVYSFGAHLVIYMLHSAPWGSLFSLHVL